MHYNLHQRLKPKKHIPYKKVIIVCILLILSLALYFLVLQSDGTAPDSPEVSQQQAT